MTALGDMADIRHFEKEFAATNRLRTEGTDNLLAAARAAGVERVVAQSYAGWPYERIGGPVKTEDDPLDPDPPAQMRATLAAIRHLERAVTGAAASCCATAASTGPGTGARAGRRAVGHVRGAQVPARRRRRRRVVVHPHRRRRGRGRRRARGLDARARSTTSSTTSPAPVREWLPALAAATGAPPPRHVPRLVGAAHGRARRRAHVRDPRRVEREAPRASSDWTPQWPTWREGFAALEPARAAA